MQTYILHTTSKSDRVQKYADIFAEEISQTKGRGEVKIIVEYVKLGSYVPTRVSPTTGRILLSWDWFEREFPKGEYDGVFFHFLPKQRSLWGINYKIGGERRVSSKEYPQVWICDDLDNAPAAGYENSQTAVRGEVVTDMLRKLFHELAHFDEDHDDQVGDLMNQDSVHDFDYRLKSIHLFHYMVDYRGRSFKNAVNQLTLKVIKLANKIF